MAREAGEAGAGEGMAGFSSRKWRGLQSVEPWPFRLLHTVGTVLQCGMMWQVWLVIATNAAMLLWGVRLTWLDHQLTHHSEVVEGRITELFEYRAKGGGTHPKFSYRYQVDGQPHTGVRHNPLRGRDYEVGERVEVHYAVKSPSHSWVEKNDEYWLVWILYLVPVVFGLAIWKAWPQIKRAQPGRRR